MRDVPRTAELRIRRRQLTKQARMLRANPTDSERVLWGCLRSRRLDGYRFVRGKPVMGCFVDFYCASARLAIELDGRVHRVRRKRDAKRDQMLGAQGVRVLRVPSGRVFSGLGSVLKEVRAALRASGAGPKTPARGVPRQRRDRSSQLPLIT